MSDEEIRRLQAEVRRLRQAVDAIGGDPRRARDAARHGAYLRPYTVVSYVAIEAGRWTYRLAPVHGGNATLNGLSGPTAGGVTYDALNRWESLAKAGYAASAVTGVLPIPVGAPVLGFWSTVANGPILLFHERNEPTCGA